MTSLGIKDDLLDAQALRALGAAPYGGADAGEVLTAASAVRGTDLDSWYANWASLASHMVTMAERERAAGRLVSARSAFFRAATYERTAGLMLLGAPLDPRLSSSIERQTDSFRRGAALLDLPPDIVEIPYEGTTLPGYFFRCSEDDAPRPTVVLVGGYDGTVEELYFLNGAAALERGYHVLAFDGPGQGSALVRQGLHMRADWEAVMTPVVDHVLTRPEVDADRLVLIGLSLGGYLAPRAASGEHRFAACVADCGSFDLYQAALDRFPKPLRGGLEDPEGSRGRLLTRALDHMAGKPTAGWALRRGLLVHGVDTPLAYLQSLRDYTLADRAGDIRCPIYISYAEGDDISASAPKLAEATTSPTELVRFTAAEGAGDHCEAGARTLYHARMFAWLDSVLGAV